MMQRLFCTVCGREVFEADSDTTSKRSGRYDCSHCGAKHLALTDENSRLYLVRLYAVHRFESSCQAVAFG